MSVFQKLALIWQRISLVHRALLLAVFLTFGLVGGLLVHWARKPDMRLLYQNLARGEASNIAEKISSKGVQYELQDGGTTIYVPEDQVYQLRLDMAKEGLPTGEHLGYKLFDSEKIGVSPFVQNVNLLRALQDELGQSIEMIDGVLSARVHIVDDEDSLFESEGDEPTASVILQIKPGHKLSALNIDAITHLIAGSVDDLDPDKVTVVDSEGRLLTNEFDENMVTSGADSVQDYRERVESNLSSKVEEMLSKVLGPGRASVKVSAIIDMKSSDTVKETYDSQGKVPKKEEIKQLKETEPAPAPAEGEAATSGTSKKDDTIITEYLVGKTIQRTTDLPGEITSLKVAAVVDLTPDVPAATGDGTETTETQGTPIMQLAQVENLIKNALGLTEADSLTVVEAEFYHPVIPVDLEEPSSIGRYLAIAKQASLGIMAVCALLVFKIFGGANKKAGATAAPQQLGQGQEVAGLLPAGGGGGNESMVLRRQIAGAMQNNPEQVKSLFMNWLAEQEE
ncbi:MAG: flagellar basal-body MS-ring/collar protein FliF [Planctomycetota bacterium]|jgi:flagellar M-ring protein FliF